MKTTEGLVGRRTEAGQRKGLVRTDQRHDAPEGAG